MFVTDINPLYSHRCFFSATLDASKIWLYNHLGCKQKPPVNKITKKQPPTGELILDF